MKAGKFVISLFWLVSIRNLFIPFAQPLYSVLLRLLPLVLFVHVLEQWRFLAQGCLDGVLSNGNSSVG